MSDAAVATPAGGEPATKKVKDSEGNAVAADAPASTVAHSAVHTLNINKAVMKDSEGKSLHELADAPVHTLEGMTTHSEELMTALGCHTIRQLAEWKYGKWAQAICILADTEEIGVGKRPAGSLMNIDNAIIKEHELKSLSEMADMHVNVLQGLSAGADAILCKLGITSVSKLANWKLLARARAIVTLAETEETKTPEEQRQAREMHKLE